MTKFQIQWKGQGDLSTLHKSRHSLGKILTGSISKIKPDDKKPCKHTTAKEKEKKKKNLGPLTVALGLTVVTCLKETT